MKFTVVKTMCMECAEAFYEPGDDLRGDCPHCEAELGSDNVALVEELHHRITIDPKTGEITIQRSESNHEQ